MTISSLLSSYLERRRAHFDLCAHPRSRTSVQTARAAHVPLHQIAKPVIVEDQLEASAVVYLGGGDHECLLHLSHAEFHALVRGARHGQFSVVPAH